MAGLKGIYTIKCPSCGVEAIVQAWTCGCQIVVSPPHLSTCPHAENFFEAYRRACGDEGPCKDHQA